MVHASTTRIADVVHGLGLYYWLMQGADRTTHCCPILSGNEPLSFLHLLTPMRFVFIHLLCYFGFRSTREESALPMFDHSSPVQLGCFLSMPFAPSLGVSLIPDLLFVHLIQLRSKTRVTSLFIRQIRRALCSLTSRRQRQYTTQHQIRLRYL